MRALVVDDEPSLLTVVAGYPRREGYTVDCAGDCAPLPTRTSSCSPPAPTRSTS
ncbi:MAG: response regulator [Micromonosporaceae bacterium]|nr:response regulator [Micromonosporaceae bacterium]